MNKKFYLIIMLFFLVGCHKQYKDMNNEVKLEVEQTNVYKDIFTENYAVNNDVFAYIDIEGTNIESVVMNSDFYIYKGLNKEYQKNGLPFVNKSFSKDENIVIYGHNANLDSSAPFFYLRNYIDESTYILEHNSILLYDNENGINKYQIFAVCRMPAEHEYFRYYRYEKFKDESDYLVFLSYIKEYQEYETNILLPEFGQQLLILSTCANCEKYPRDLNQRIVIVAKKVEFRI